MIPKPITRVLVALALALCAFAVSSCSQVEEPKMTIEDVHFKGISTEGLEFMLTVEVANPNTFGAVIDYVEYSVDVDHREVARGRQIKDVKVPAGATVDVEVPFAVRWDGFKDALSNMFDGEEHDWGFEGQVRLKKGGLTRTFSFEERGSFEAPDIGDIQIDIDTGSL